MTSWFSTDVTDYLISDEGEEIIDEVTKHPIAMSGGVLAIIAAMIAFSTMALLGSAWWIFLILGCIGFGYGVLRIQQVRLDRFVITNMRVFRVAGVFQKEIATMPMSRILDIAVTKPISGRILGYGHFVFESAAQAQGLREIRFVPRPHERDLTIQRVIARAGLRPRAEG